MRGGQGERFSAEAAAHGDPGKQQALGHGRAGAVQSEGRHVVVPHGKAGADALVEQIAYKGGIKVGFLQLGVFQRKAQRGFLHLRFGLFPAFLAEGGVLRGQVEGVAQRPLRLFFARDGSVGENHGRPGKDDALPSAMVFHLRSSIH